MFFIVQQRGREWVVIGCNTGDIISVRATREEVQDIADELDAEADTELCIDMISPTS